MGRATSATINLSALCNNYKYAKQCAADSQVVAIIKADAYGHGAVPVAQALTNIADAFGVACIEEALVLREAGIQNPIILLEGFFTADEIPVIAEQGLITAVHSAYQVEALLSTKINQKIDVWLKFDSGMHRLGFDEVGYQNAYTQLNACQHIDNIMGMTHFACADELDNDYTNQQLENFKQANKDLPLLTSLANSPATLGWQATHTEWVRAGILLYGSSPLPTSHISHQHLQAVMTLSAPIIAIRDLAVGESIGYGRRFICERPTRMAVVAIGYGDGYPRHAKNGTPVYVNGHTTQLIGRVSMDMITIDITDLENINIGDRVELWGENVSVNTVAECSDTIAYELLTCVTARATRQYEPV